MKRGQTITEYLFTLSLITLAAILALTLFGGGVGNSYNNITNTLPLP